MDKFITNAAGNIDSGTEVLANNLTFMQQGTEKLFSKFFGNTFTEGIVNTNNAESMFPLTANADGSFNIGQGIAYKYDVTSEMVKRIEIPFAEIGIEYSATNATQTTDDGTGNTVLTPKSSGCKNITIPLANTTYWVDLQYLQVCDNGNTGDGLGLKNYSIAKNISPNDTTQIKRFFQWVDGYKVVLQTTKNAVAGICLGTVIKDSSNAITFSYVDRAANLLINSNAFLEYLTSGSGIYITTDPTTNKSTISVDNSVPFSINGGPITGQYLAWGGQTIQLIASVTEPLILHPANAPRYSVNGSMVEPINIQLAVQELEGTSTNINGIYTLCINATDKSNNNAPLQNPIFEVMRDVEVSKTEPTAPKGTIWLDTSSQPHIAKWYNGSAFVEYKGVPVAYVRITNTALAVANGVSMFDYNKDYSQWNELGKIEPITYRVDDGIYPDKDLILDGSTVNIIDYYDFYKATKHDTSNTTITTFDLEDALGKTLWGGLTVTYLEAGIPNIKGYFESSSGGFSTPADGPFTVSGWNYSATGSGQGYPRVNFDASKGEIHDVSGTPTYRNDVIGKSDTVQPPALQVPILVRALL